MVPGRFAAPVAGFGAELLLLLSQSKYTHNATYGLVSPTNNWGLPGLDAGLFFPFAADVSIVQMLFLAGRPAPASRALGLPARGGRRLRGAAALVTVLGLTAAGTGVALAGTTEQTAAGHVIPALHDAAADRPVRYLPVCAGSPVPVRLHPAYRGGVIDFAASLEPVLSEVDGLPGAPVRVLEIATDHLPDAQMDLTVTGTPPVLSLPLGWEGWTSDAQLASWERPLAATAVVDHVIGAQSLAQRAVAAGLLQAVGAWPGAPTPLLTVQKTARPAPGTAVYAAARRFAALPAAARHAWLIAHLAALRAARSPWPRCRDPRDR